MRFSVEAVEAALLEFVTKDILLRKDPIGLDVDLFESGFDSLSLSRVLVFIEKRFNTKVPDEEIVIDEIATVSSMARFFHSYIAKTNA